MVNFYKNMWPKRSSILGPLTDMTGKGKKFTWGEAQQRAFNNNSIISMDYYIHWQFPERHQSQAAASQGKQ